MSKSDNEWEIELENHEKEDSNENINIFNMKRHARRVTGPGVEKAKAGKGRKKQNDKRTDGQSPLSPQSSSSSDNGCHVFGKSKSARTNNKKDNTKKIESQKRREDSRQKTRDDVTNRLPSPVSNKNKKKTKKGC